MKEIKQTLSGLLNSLFFRSIISRKLYANWANLIFVIGFLFFGTSQSFSQTNDDCFSCHNDPELSKIRSGKKVSLYVKPEALNNSVHSTLECTFCHPEAAVTDFPHPENMAPVNCGDCHDVAMGDFMEGLHGAALKRNDKNAPTCKECHGSHQIINPKLETMRLR